MAAYAALVSLINITDQIKAHPRLSTFLDTNQIASLRQNVDILLNFIENYTSHGVNAEAEFLEREIAAVAQAAEDIIESHIVDLINSGFTDKTPMDLHTIEENMNSVKEKVAKVEDEMGFRDKRRRYSKPAPPLRTDSTGKRKTTVVGFDGYSSQLTDRLTSLQSDRQLIPIVGMGGIGKTTLARNVYGSSIILHYFHVRAWATISQHYNLREVLLEIISCLEGTTSQRDQKTEEELAEKLHEILSGRRYLVVVDDMWSIEAWHKLKFYFPENHNGSRIIVTTREQEVAEDFGSTPLFLNLLDDSRSWELFSLTAFGQESFPLEVEEVGRSIVKRCKGLPLAIVVTGGFLARSPMFQEYWEYVEDSITSILKLIENDHCLNIISLSYNYLPAHLKPCFLHLGIFKEDHEIRVSRLVKLWAAEGFIKPHKDRSLEKVAAGYIKDLVDRNLVLVHDFGLNKKIKTIHIHDRVRDLCLKICEKEKFICVVRENMFDTPQDTDRERRIVVHESVEEGDTPRYFHMESTRHARSIVYRSYCHSSFKSRLLRVLSSAHGDSLASVFELVNLRHLEYHQSLWITFNIPSAIPLLWTLQTLIITGCVNVVVAPSEIWNMPQLRHLKLSWRVRLSDPPSSTDQEGVFLLENLETLRTVTNFKCSHEFCKRIPNIRKLAVTFDEDMDDVKTVASYCLYNVGLLNKLESLNYCFLGNRSRDVLVPNLKFPSSLRKLVLEGCKLVWEDLTMIGSLPCLEVLKLEYSVFGPEWNPNKGEFTRLKRLELSCCRDLTRWNCNRSHFPVLEEIELASLWKLEEIPLDIGEISTLREIYVYACSIFIAVSAVRILEEQENFGNEDLRVRFKLEDVKREEFREKLEEEGLTTENFLIDD